MKYTDTLVTLYRHHLWANTGLFHACAKLTNQQLDATAVGTFGTIRDTLQHIVDAERSYIARITTGQPFRRPADAPPLSIADMLESLRTSGTQLIEWAPLVQADDLVQVKWQDGSMADIPKTILLTQAINHATEHRAQIMAIMTQLGVEPPDLDAWSFFEAQLSAS